jgi:probable F420-dependent oxidoreductase
MQVGAVFPQTEIGSDPLAIRDYGQAAEGLGYAHLLIYDHVIGAAPGHPGDPRGYSRQLFHEPFVLMGYMAACTHLELVPAVIILPQRQTVLVAKQAAEVDVLTGGRLRLGVGIGWNPVEYEALGMSFRSRAHLIEEQVQVLRLLWSEHFATYRGQFHVINAAGLNPLPMQRPIPIWFGGSAETLLRRVARLGDGWFPQGAPDEQMEATLERLRGYIREAGRNPAAVGIEARVDIAGKTPEVWRALSEAWRALGATHLAVNTMGAGFVSVDEHIAALRRYRESLADLFPSASART